MSAIEVKELKKDEYKMWDELVENSPQGMIFHSSDWLTACSKSLNKELKICGCFWENQLIGGCALSYQKKTIFKFAYSPPPNTGTPHGGLLLRPLGKNVRKNESLLKAIINGFLDVLKDEGLDYISLINCPTLIDIRPFTYNGWKNSVQYTYMLDLDGNLWTHINKKTRGSIRSAEKNNVHIIESNNLNKFYKLFETMFKQQRISVPISKDVIASIFNFLSKKNLCEMWFAETDSGELVSALIAVWDNSRPYFWVGASDADLNAKIGGNSLMYWHALQYLLSKNFSEVVWVGANTPKLNKFKAGFNPKLVPYYVVEKTSIRYKMLGKGYYIYKKLRK